MLKDFENHNSDALKLTAILSVSPAPDITLAMYAAYHYLDIRPVEFAKIWAEILSLPIVSIVEGSFDAQIDIKDAQDLQDWIDSLYVCLDIDFSTDTVLNNFINFYSRKSVQLKGIDPEFASDTEEILEYLRSLDNERWITKNV